MLLCISKSIFLRKADFNNSQFENLEFHFHKQKLLHRAWTELILYVWENLQTIFYVTDWNRNNIVQTLQQHGNYHGVVSGETYFQFSKLKDLQ